MTNKNRIVSPYFFLQLLQFLLSFELIGSQYTESSSCNRPKAYLQTRNSPPRVAQRQQIVPQQWCPKWRHLRTPWGLVSSACEQELLNTLLNTLPGCLHCMNMNCSQTCNSSADGVSWSLPLHYQITNSGRLKLSVKYRSSKNLCKRWPQQDLRGHRKSSLSPWKWTSFTREGVRRSKKSQFRRHVHVHVHLRKRLHRMYM